MRRLTSEKWDAELAEGADNGLGSAGGVHFGALMGLLHFQLIAGKGTRELVCHHLHGWLGKPPPEHPHMKALSTRPHTTQSRSMADASMDVSLSSHAEVGGRGGGGDAWQTKPLGIGLPSVA